MAAVASLSSSPLQQRSPAAATRSSSGYFPLLKRGSRSAPIQEGAEAGLCTASAFARMHDYLGNATEEITEVLDTEESVQSGNSRSLVKTTSGYRDAGGNQGADRATNANTFMPLSQHSNRCPSRSPPKFVSQRRVASISPPRFSHRVDAQVHTDARRSQSTPSPSQSIRSTKASSTLPLGPEQEPDSGLGRAAKRVRLSDCDETTVARIPVPAQEEDVKETEVPQYKPEVMTSCDSPATKSRDNEDESVDMLPDVSLLVDYVPAVMKKKQNKKKPAAAAAKKPARARTITAKAIEFWKTTPDKPSDSTARNGSDQLKGTAAARLSVSKDQTTAATATNSDNDVHGDAVIDVKASTATAISTKKAPRKSRKSKAVATNNTTTDNSSTSAVAPTAATAADQAEEGALCGDINAAGESKTKVKTRQSRKKKKAGSSAAAAPAPRLPSPLSAQRTIVAQDVFFGTSSQLAHDMHEPPSYWRDLQTAIKASEKEETTAVVDDDDDAGINDVSAVPKDGLLNEITDKSTSTTAGDGGDYELGSNRRVYTSKIAAIVASRNLWCAGDRDEHGTVMLAEKLPSTPTCLRHAPFAAAGNLDKLDCGGDARTRTPCDPAPNPPALAPGTLRVRSDPTSPSPTLAPSGDIASTLSISRSSKRPRLVQRAGVPLSQISQNTVPLPSPSPLTLSAQIQPRRRSLSTTTTTTAVAAAAAAAATTENTEKAGRQRRGSSPRKTTAAKKEARPKKEAATSVPAKATTTTATATKSTKRARGRPRKVSVTTEDPITIADDAAANSAYASMVSTAAGGADKSPLEIEAAESKGTVTATGSSEWTHIDDLQASTPPEKAKWTHIDEIEDSEAETDVFTCSPSSSPPRRKSAAKMDTLELLPPETASSSSSSVAAAAATSERERAQKLLFAQITRAVKSAPRSTNPKSPSWHEKMLTYDPIVLEDLAAWLNAGALCHGGGRSEDEPPLDPAVLQKWCEEKSVCCLWRDGLRGGVKVRY